MSGMEDTASDTESDEDGVGERDEATRRQERRYGPEDVKKALRTILARSSVGQKLDIADLVKNQMGFPSMESHVSYPGGPDRRALQRRVHARVCGSSSERHAIRPCGLLTARGWVGIDADPPRLFAQLREQVKLMLKTQPTPPHLNAYSARVAFIEAYEPKRKGPAKETSTRSPFTEYDSKLIAKAVDIATRGGFPFDRTMVRAVLGRRVRLPASPV